MNTKNSFLLLLFFFNAALTVKANMANDFENEANTHTVIRLPAHRMNEPVEVINTEEFHQETVVVDHYIERHIWQTEDDFWPVYIDVYRTEIHQGH